MKISYNWLSNYLPEKIEPQKLSEILTSIGLEVESLESYENFKGGLKGLVAGEVLTCEQHPNADKLKLTKVDIDKEEPLQIVCGAPNVAAGQKVIVAPVGTTIYPYAGNTVTMKVAKIRGIKSEGMICAEDEIGLSDNHAGIMILPAETKTGTAIADLFDACSDWIYEIGLTPNRMDAMSHIGVAKDVCAWLSFHENKPVQPLLPYKNSAEKTFNENNFEVIIENTRDCKRYSGALIENIAVKESPAWLQHYLKAIGQRPINNVVDITNFVLHETGQPLHAFDADVLSSKKVIIKNVADGTIFKTLDDIDRKLSSKDLMICNNDEPVCIAGIFGGAGSGVSSTTKNIFLESAWFSHSSIRASSLHHGLRTEAAIRFEKGVDISGTVVALSRAAQLINEAAGGETKKIIDVYPEPVNKKEITLKYAYLKKLSGKVYSPQAVKNILTALEFDILNEDEIATTVAAPFSKADITLPADVVEEIIRIDGLNNIEIPKTITVTPSVNENSLQEQLKGKLAQMLAGLGFNEVIINSISNSKIYGGSYNDSIIKLLNNLSADLDVLRPSILETGLEIIAYNLNRKNNNLRFFELGKIYEHHYKGYTEQEKICFWLSNKKEVAGWKHQNIEADFFTAKGIINSLLQNINIDGVAFKEPETNNDGIYQTVQKNKIVLGKLLQVDNDMLLRFGIKQPVIYAELDLENIINITLENEIIYKEIPQFPVAERDLSIVMNKNVTYNKIASSLEELNVKFLDDFDLFDIYEGEKIGNGKKSFAINFKFSNKEKTLTDAEVEDGMKTIADKLITEFNAEIRH